MTQHQKVQQTIPDKTQPTASNSSEDRPVYLLRLCLLFPSLLLAAISLFLPWFRSGSVNRNSFEMFELRGIVEQLYNIRYLELLRAIWVLLPMAFALAVLLLALSKARSGIVILSFDMLILSITASLVIYHFGFMAGPATALTAGFFYILAMAGRSIATLCK
jgi:hypothetical protein